MKKRSLARKVHAVLMSLVITFTSMNLLSAAGKVSASDSSGSSTVDKTLTYSDWEIVDGVFEQGVGYSLTDGSITSLDGYAFEGYMNFGGATDASTTYFKIGGSADNAHLAFQLNAYETENLQAVNHFNTDNQKFYQPSGWSNSGEMLVRLTFDETETNTWDVGIYVNDTYVDTMTLTNTALGTKLLLSGNITVCDMKIYYDDGATTEKEYNIKDYWTTDTKKAPVKAGFVFGGWYVTEDKTRVPLTEADLKEKGVDAYADTAYAKFVPVDVLSIKTQKGTADEITSLRILSTVDSTNYQAVGFEYKLATNSLGTTGNITKVYSAIKPYKGATDAELYKPGSTFVSGASKYFIAADVSEISSGSFAKIVYARPYWITMDGTKVMGLARNSRVEDKDNNYTSVGINLLPQLVKGELAAVAVGKIQVTYNTDNYDVVESGVDTTYDTTNGGTYLFPEMEYYINEEKGTITFVGNAADVTKNLTADGLFANIRFKKAENATGTELDFAINADETEFCNWAEAPVTKFVVQ